MKELGKLGLLTDKQKQKLKDNIEETGDQLSQRASARKTSPSLSR